MCSTTEKRKPEAKNRWKTNHTGHFVASKSVFNDRKPKADRKPMENETIDSGALYVFNTESRKPKAEGRKPIENEPRGHSGALSTIENRKPKAESRKPIESEPRGHSGDHYSREGPRGKGRKLAWQGAWHETRRAQRSCAAFLSMWTSGSEAGACW